MAKASVFSTLVCIGCCLMLLALAVCAILGLVFASIQRGQSHVHTYCVDMTKNDVPPLPATGGDTDGRAFGYVTINVGTSVVSYYIKTENIDPDVPISLEIRGPATTGIGVVQIGGLDPTLDDDNIMSGSKEIFVETIVKDVVESSYLHYIILKTTGHPAGSIAARLGGNECRLS